MNEYIQSIIFLQRLLSKRWPSKGSIRSISQESFSTNCWRGPCHIVTSVTKIRSQDTKNILWWFSSEVFPYDKPCPLREMQQTISQILFMVGCGFLKADMMKLRTDTPKVPPTTISCESLRTKHYKKDVCETHYYRCLAFQALRRLLDTCLSYSRDGRSSFRNVNICLWNVFSHLKLWMIFDTSPVLTQVLVSLENLMSSLPKIHKSLSGALSI